MSAEQVNQVDSGTGLQWPLGHAPARQSWRAIALAGGLLGLALLLALMRSPGAPRFSSTVILATGLVALAWLGKLGNRPVHIQKVLLWLAVGIGVIAWLGEMVFFLDTLVEMTPQEYGWTLLCVLPFVALMLASLFWRTTAASAKLRINSISVVYAGMLLVYTWGQIVLIALSRLDWVWVSSAQSAIPEMILIAILLWFTPWTPGEGKGQVAGASPA